RLARPESLVLDRDQPEGRFDLAVRTALVTREVLDELGIGGCAKTSGAKGVHVYVPIRRSYDYEQVRRAAHRLALRVADREPELVTAEFKRAERGGRVFLDFTRTGKGQHM